MMWDAITDVPGVAVGHWTDTRAATGCTVVLCEDGAVAGVDVRGSAPGTRETDLMRPMNLVKRAHAIMLSGGSAYGLESAGGAMRFLEERGKGFRIRRWRVPIVGGAVLMDLGIGNGRIRPGSQEGYAACETASRGTLAQGSVGAGTGATVGKANGRKAVVKGGLGTASMQFEDGTIVGAVVAVNAFGEIVDPKSGHVLAGPRCDGSGKFQSTLDLLTKGQTKTPIPGDSTTIGVVATNARLTKEQANKMAQMAQDGIGMAIRPAHTMGDGDVVFALATGRGLKSRRQPNVTAVGALAAEMLALAITRGVSEATSLADVPAVRDLE